MHVVLSIDTAAFRNKYLGQHPISIITADMKWCIVIDIFGMKVDTFLLKKEGKALFVPRSTNMM